MKWYKLVFKQNQPIHIGKFNWGVVSETEIFIPGQTIWGAIVNYYIMNEGISSEDKLDKLKEALKNITNFFPSFNGINILEPVYNKYGEFAYKIKEEENEKLLTEDRFRLYFVDAEFKTSIDPFSLTAKEEKLYEFEYILPAPKREFKEKIKEFNESLYWIGLLGQDNGLKDDKYLLKKGMKIYVGGDVRYGFGELELVHITEVKGDELKRWHLDKKGNFIFQESTPLLNFVEFKNSIKFSGKLKLIVEMDFLQNEPVVMDAGYYIIPGSIIKNNKNSKNNSKYKLNKGKFKKDNKDNQQSAI